VKVQGDGLPTLLETERDLLSGEEIAAGYRLACRTVIQNDVVVYVPEMSRPRAQKLQVAGREEAVECCPPVHKFFLNLPAPTLKDTRSDLKRTEEELEAGYDVSLESVDLAVLPKVGLVAVP
jgi:uncharacterized 2Fe-2S/4Fe-4S cluster protein (DUF4445 family)